MASPPRKRRKAAIADVPIATPAPPSGPLATTSYTISAGTHLHRVHKSKYNATQLNPITTGNARFSPISDKDNEPVATMYAASTRDAALMETLFHDVPYTSGLKTLDSGKMDGLVHSEITAMKDINLVDLTGVPLRKLGLTRKQIIDTEKDCYPLTRSWAEAIHTQCPDAQGLSWMSRQDDTARAYVFFGDRLSAGALSPVGTSKSLAEDSETTDAVYALAERIGVVMVDGDEGYDE